MAIEIQFDDKELIQVMKSFDVLKKDVLPKSMRQALNKSVRSVRTKTNEKIREKYKLKKSYVNRDVLTMWKASGSNINNMNAGVTVGAESISLRHFMKGTKDAYRPNFQGKKPKARKGKRIRFEVQPGKVTTMEKAFYAHGQHGNAQVFVRKGKKRLPIVKQSVRGVSAYVNKAKTSAQLQQYAQQRLSIEFNRAYRINVRKIYQKNLRG